MVVVGAETDFPAGKNIFYSFYVSNVSMCKMCSPKEVEALSCFFCLRCVPELKAAALHWIHRERSIGSHAAHGQKCSESKWKVNEIHRKYSFLSCSKCWIMGLGYERMYVCLHFHVNILACVRVCFSTNSLHFSSTAGDGAYAQTPRTDFL